MMVCLIGMLLPMCMFAQQITVQGVVKDQTGETVIGASVMEKGTTNGTITGIDGDFSLNMSSNGTLVVSFVGYKTQEVQVKGQKQLQVVLSEDAEMLDEVVADEKTLEEWLFERKKAEVIFAVVEGEEVGFALFFHNFSTFLGRAGLYLEDLYVKPEHRGNVRESHIAKTGRHCRREKMRPFGMVVPGLEQTQH